MNWRSWFTSLLFIMEGLFMDKAVFSRSVISIIEEINATQEPAIKQAGSVIKNSIEAGGVLHAFSAGHSHMMVEELFYRAGGLVPVNPIFDPNTMLHYGGRRSTGFERLPGYAKTILDAVETRPGEPIIVVSHSGINVLPVELALLAGERGLQVIAITSKTISSQLESRVPSKEHLYDAAQIVIDNCIRENEMAVVYDEEKHRVGAYSTVITAYIIQKLVIEVAYQFVQDGEKPPIFLSANLPGGDEWNAALINKYNARVRLL